MENLMELMTTRRSIRKFLEEPVPRQVIEDCVAAAAYAPCACNSQMWRFAIVDDPGRIAGLAQAVADHTREFYGTGADEKFIRGRVLAATHFCYAPALILVCMEPLTYYDPRVVRYFRAKGFDHEGMMARLGYPDYLSMGAAIENLLLEVHNQGYGACWMNDPIFSAPAIAAYLSLPPAWQPVSLISLGKPRYRPRTKQVKGLSELLIYC
ncbi:MAG: nitroreductase family protein [Peptococcaceae bacterium]|nr:nitroreductase family protein [Peptococcaceae bacterium]